MNRLRDRVDALEEAFGIKKYNTLESQEERQFCLERLEKIRKEAKKNNYNFGKVERISASPYFLFSLNRE